MLTLVTTNASKYAPFMGELERLRITLEPPREELLELQSLSFAEVLAGKARAAASMFGRPVLVDEAGLVLAAYRPFPGPLTSAVARSLGTDGLRRLLSGVSDRSDMECHIGCWVNGALRSWAGKVSGRLDVSRRPRDQRLMLSDLFVPDGRADNSELLHRAGALAALATAAFELHLDTAAEPPEEITCRRRSAYECQFCCELEGDNASIYASMMGERLPSRAVYEDEHFVVMPPLGQFVEGGLLLLTRQHILSLAHLRPELFGQLERLLQAVCAALVEQWRVPPLVFEHGPAPEWGKGVCCVDHAHLNIFPVSTQVHPRLARRMNLAVGSLSELGRLRRAEFGYLFVQENDGARRAYDGQQAPTQLIRRIIAGQVGRPERWDWREYPGCDELVATFKALKGKIRL